MWVSQGLKGDFQENTCSMFRPGDRPKHQKHQTYCNTNCILSEDLCRGGVHPLPKYREVTRASPRVYINRQLFMRNQNPVGLAFYKTRLSRVTAIWDRLVPALLQLKTSGRPLYALSPQRLTLPPAPLLP